jgi:hypothetical protein
MNSLVLDLVGLFILLCLGIHLVNRDSYRAF